MSTTELTAAEVLVLSALAAGRPMTDAETARAVSDMGMHLQVDYVAAALGRLAAHGLAELTAAASLGKYRLTPPGRAWLASHSAGR